MRADTETGGELAVGLPDALARPSQPLSLPGRTAGVRWKAARRRSRALSVPVARPRWWLDALALLWLGWVYDLIANLAPLRQSAAVNHALGVLDLERTLHLDPELALNRWLVPHHTLGLALSDYYDNAHFLVTLSILAWLWWRRADLYRPLRNALVLINVLGLAVFWLYPLAPPRMLAGFSDVVADTHAFGSWHTGPLASAANQLAAMPSLHMAWAAWCGLALWRLSSSPYMRALALIYPCLTCLAVLATGNHFLLDVFAGLATAALAVALARALPVVAGGLAGALARALPRTGSACHKLVTKSKTG